MERLTEHEAIEYLLGHYLVVGSPVNPPKKECEKHNEVMDMAIYALNKQIPTKPYRISEIDDNDNAMVECPICHANSDYSINTIKSGYCWKCGQKLDWKDMKGGAV